MCTDERRRPPAGHKQYRRISRSDKRLCVGVPHNAPLSQRRAQPWPRGLQRGYPPNVGGACADGRTRVCPAHGAIVGVDSGRGHGGGQGVGVATSFLSSPCSPSALLLSLPVNLSFWLSCYSASIISSHFSQASLDFLPFPFVCTYLSHFLVFFFLFPIYHLLSR